MRNAETAIELTYQIVRAWTAAGHFAGPAYVMAADRSGSMLFDADPESSVRFVAANSVLFAIQFADFARMSFDTPPSNILAQVQGKWTGAVYEREFTTPNGRPYAFLGRHRVLVAKATALADHVRKLAAENRTLAIANLVADLREDAEGFTPNAVAHLM